MRTTTLYLIVVMVVLCFIAKANTQNPKLDSLWNEFRKAKHDTSQCNIYIEIGDYYKPKNFDSSLYYYSKSLDLSERKSAKKVYARTLNRIGNLYNNRNQNDFAISFYERAIKASKDIGANEDVAGNYMNIGNIYKDQYKFDLAIEVYLKSLKIFEDCKSKKGETLCLNNLGKAHSGKKDYEKAIEYFSRSLKIKEDLNDSKGIAGSLNSIGIMYRNKGDYDQATAYFEKYISISKEINDSIDISQGLNNLGNILNDKGKYDEANAVHLEALKIRELLKDNYGMAESNLSIGNILKDKGQYNLAIDSYFKALKQFETINHKIGMAYCFNNIAIIHAMQKNYDLTLEYIQKSMEIKQEIGDKRGVSSSFNNMGNIYIEQSKLCADQTQKVELIRKAIEHKEKSLRIREEIGDKYGIAECYSDIGIIYKNEGDYRKAIDYYQKALVIDTEIGNKKGMALGYNNMSGLYIRLADSSLTMSNLTLQKDYLNKAISLSHSSLLLAREMNAMPLVNGAANNLMILYKKLNNFEKAFEFAEIYISTKDSMFNEEKTKAITEMQTKYETEKKQQEIEKQQLVIEKQEIENIRQRNQRNFFIAGTFLLGLLALVVLRGYQQKKRSNTIISEKNVLLEQANEEISAQRDMVTEQKDHIEHIHGELTSSIRYAQRIQAAVLPSQEQMAELLGDHFVLFKPKDIVSGDFFWATRVKQYLIFCVADCTGHGVPGAFMSMLGVSFLNDIVHKEHVTTASEVLNQLRNSVIAALKQRGEMKEQKDGMDMGLCVINTETRQMQFAGGYNPCWIIPNPEHTNQRLIEPKLDGEPSDENALIQLKPDKMPIAIHKNIVPFTNYILQLFPGDQVYLMSDGYQDQFGGPNGKKFMVKNLRELVVANAHLPMGQQRELLDVSLEEWKNGIEQVDDVTIVGVRV